MPDQQALSVRANHPPTSSRGHEHSFGQQHEKAGERRSHWVIALTAATMVIEIAAGIVFGSMALLADGLHMASHAAALAITAVAYAYARRHAHDSRFSFGTGKVGSLAGFTSAVVLAIFALLMAFESISRFFYPIAIAYDEAIAVAILGLLINGASVLILHAPNDPGRARHDHESDHHHHDHNLRAAYLHVLADALTSILAIVALLSGKLLQLTWMDPAMGIIGALLVARWSWGLLCDSGAVLLDRQAEPEIAEAITRAIVEPANDTWITDLHIWAIGPSYRAAIIAVTSSRPLAPSAYKQALPHDLGLAHITIEVEPLA